jgi:hypothetical protein
MTDKRDSSSLYFADVPIRQMLEILIRPHAGKVILADGDDERQRTKAIACARENALPLLLISVHPDCPLPEGIRCAALTRPFPFDQLRQLLQELCGSAADPAPKAAPSPLLWDRTDRILRFRTQSVALTEREAALFDVLWNAMPGCAAESELRAAFSRTEGNGPQVYITYLRRKLKQLPLPIHIVSRRGEGYALLIPEEPQS